MSNIAIIGSGSFGCALANSLSKHSVKIWSFKEKEANIINNEHRCMFIENSKLDEKIKCYTSYEEVINNSDYIFLVTPSKVIKNTILNIKKYITNQKIIIASKGFELETNKTLYEVVKEELKNNKIGVLSGPSLANEVINKKSAIINFASNEINNEVKELFFGSNITIEESNDIIGTEIGGSLKNIIALASGILSGLNAGDNIKSMLVVRGLNEIKTLGEKMGANSNSFYGPSGLGDLILTCNSDKSRNYRAGVLISQNKKIEEVKKEIGMVIEGLDALNVAYNLSIKYNTELPIINNLYRIIYEEKDVKEILEAIIFQ